MIDIDLNDPEYAGGEWLAAPPKPAKDLKKRALGKRIIERVKLRKTAAEIITKAGAQYHGPQEDGKGGHAALVTDPDSGSTGMIPFREVTHETVKAKLAEIRTQAKKTEAEDIVRMATQATVAALTPTLQMLAKGQEAIVEGLNAETESIPVRDAQKRIEKVIKRRVQKGGAVQPIPETKLPKGTGPTVAS